MFFILPQIRKPLVEKKRRDRINELLNQLKSIILETTKHEVRNHEMQYAWGDINSVRALTRLVHGLCILQCLMMYGVLALQSLPHSRLEKADILELTVKYLQDVTCKEPVGKYSNPFLQLQLPFTFPLNLNYSVSFSLAWLRKF